ncbi:MAG: amidase family protein [Pseudomonadota bacterium]
MTDTDVLWRRDAVALSTMIRTGQVSSEEVMAAHIARMEEVNPKYNSVALPLGDQAMSAAKAADKAIANGETVGPLHGVPVTTKVNTDQEGTPNDNGVVAFKDVMAPADSPQIANLKKSGAIVIGRTNTPAFSMRWFTTNDLHGETLNPWNTNHTPGGSSGGASSSVASGIAPIGHGNDIAGSVRYPAYCCGLVGLRPTHGRVPAWNPSANVSRPISAQLMSVQGPLTRSVRDARVAFAAMAKGDVNDPKWVDVPLEGPPVARPIRVAMVETTAGRPINPEVRASVQTAAKWLENAGYQVESVEPPELEAVNELWSRIGMDDVIASLRPAIEQYGDEAIKTAVGYWIGGFESKGPQGVLDALVEREQYLRLWQLFCEDYPLILMPSSAEPAFPNQLDIQGLAEYQRIWQAQWPQLCVPVLGLPAANVPTGEHDGLPMGVQLVAARFREDLILDAAEVIEAQAPTYVPLG